MRPAPEESNVQLLRPISFSLRDTETHVNATSLQIATGYSRIYGRGKDFFDREVPNTFRRGLVDIPVVREPLVSLIPNPPPDEAVRIKKVTDDPERSVYFTKVAVDDTRAFRNVMVSALIKPVTIASEPTGDPYGYSGAVLGLEMGPRNTSALAFFRVIDGVRHVLLTGPLNQAGNLPQNLVEYDWSVNQRFTLFWNESRGLVQLFANNNELVASSAISLFPEFDALAPRHGSDGEYVIVYGLEGAANDEVEISAISFTDDVGYPLVGVSKPNSFNTFCRSADMVKTTPGVDPRKDEVSPWYDDNGTHFEPFDENGSVRMGLQGLQMARVTKDPRSLAIYREEPGFLLSNTEGYAIDISLHGTSTSRDGDTTGMGFVVYDGFSVFQVACLQVGTTRLLGVRTTTDDATALAGYNSATYDWSVPSMLRFVVDGRAGRIRIYKHPVLNVPLLDTVLDRSAYPDATAFGWENFVPFLGIGHFDDVEATGSLYLREVRYTHFYRSWDAYDGVAPNDPSLPLPFTRAGTGTAPSGAITGSFQITCTRAQTLVYSSEAASDVFRGATVEARVAISGSDRNEPTGDAIVFDDGLRRFILSFTETDEGRFACLALRADLNGYQEIAGFDPESMKLSFRVDWTQPHTYRLERKPFEGVFIFVDNETRPRLVFPENRLGELPDTLFTTPTVAFGHFITNSKSSANWYFFRSFYSTGFEISFKRNRPDVELKDRLFATEAVVLVEAADADPSPPPPPECTGGIPFAMAGGGLVGPFNFENDSSADLYNQFNWDVIQHLGTQVQFHFSGFVTFSPGCTSLFIRVHLGGDTVFGIPGVVIHTFTLTQPGMFYELIPAIALPTGLKKIRFSAQGAPASQAAIDRAVFALEVL